VIKLNKIIKELMLEALPPSPAPSSAIHVQHQEFSPDFVEYMRTVENSIGAGFNKQERLWYPYKDPSGWHIAYGHKLKVNEIIHYRHGISQEAAEKLLAQDLQIAKRRVHNYIKETYKVDILLTKKQEEMLIDFAFNLGGLEKFPKFVDAVLRNRTDIIKREYIRNFAGKELTGRNEAFFNRFLS
jgi:GH24 family phage-related lysozyme (muramidase)